MTRAQTRSWQFRVRTFWRAAAALLLVPLAPSVARAQEDLLMVQYIPWWGRCVKPVTNEWVDGGRHINKVPITAPGWDAAGIDTSVVRNPDVDDNGVMDGIEEVDVTYFPEQGYQGTARFLDAQLRKMRKAGVKIVAIEWGNTVDAGGPYICQDIHISRLIEQIEAHPEYGIKFIISYSPEASQVRRTSGIKLDNDWCTYSTGEQFGQFRQDMDEIYAKYAWRQSYFRPVLNGVSRPVVYIYAAWSIMRDGVSAPADCQSRKRSTFHHAKAFNAQDFPRYPQANYVGNYYFIGDVGWNMSAYGGSDYYPAYDVFDAAANFGEAGIYDLEASQRCTQANGGWSNSDIVNIRTQYKRLNQYTADLRAYLLDTSVGGYPSRVERFAANRVDGQDYKQSYVGGISIYNNNIRKVQTYPWERNGCPTLTYRSIAGVDGDYERQFFNQMQLGGRQVTRRGGAAWAGGPKNLPFGMTLVATWNGYDEGTGIETTVGLDANKNTVQCRPEIGRGSAPSFPYYVDASSLWLDNCTGDFFIDGFKKRWNLALWLPEPGPSQWIWRPDPDDPYGTSGYYEEIPPSWPAEQSGYNVPRTSMSGVTIGQDPLNSQYVYQFPAVDASTAYVTHANNLGSSGYTASEVTGFPARFSVEATIRRAAPFLNRKTIVSNQINWVGWHFMIGDNNELAFIWATAGGVWNGLGGGYCPNAQILDENWHKVAASLGDGVLKLYIDDVEVCSAGGMPDLEYNNNPTTIGNLWAGGLNGWMGSIKDVKIYVGRFVPER